MRSGVRDGWHGASAEVFCVPAMALSKGSLCLKGSDFPVEESCSLVWTVSFTKPQRVFQAPFFLEAPLCIASVCVYVGGGGAAPPLGVALTAPFSTSPPSPLHFCGVETNQASDNQVSL